MVWRGVPLHNYGFQFCPSVLMILFTPAFNESDMT